MAENPTFAHIYAVFPGTKSPLAPEDNSAQNFTGRQMLLDSTGQAQPSWSFTALSMYHIYMGEWEGAKITRNMQGSGERIPVVAWESSPACANAAKERDS